MDIIKKSMKIGEIKEILKFHGIELAYMWEICLYMIFETLETDTLEIIGFGDSAEFAPIYE